MKGNGTQKARETQEVFGFLCFLCSCLLLSTLLEAQTLPLEPAHESGASITGAFEGWFKNADGSFSLLLGYFNRNTKQEVDLPIGTDNRIEPGGPDQGQPTHFLSGRQWGMFTVKVPADFGTKKLTWTIAANGQTQVIPVSLHPDYEISPLVEAAVRNTPPVIRFEENGPSAQGPAGMTFMRTAKAGVPMSLTIWATDDARLTTQSGVAPRNLGAPVTLRWTKFRGPGTVSFTNPRPQMEKLAGGNPGTPFSGKATTSATFGSPGEYVLHVVLNDYSGEGGGGFQCCWTNGQVKVSVAR
jgi:hypothetical protein